MSSDSFKSLEETERQRKVEAFEKELKRKTKGAREKVLHESHSVVSRF
jgi:hypothetical protein